MPCVGPGPNVCVMDWFSGRVTWYNMFVKSPHKTCKHNMCVRVWFSGSVGVIRSCSDSPHLSAAPHGSDWSLMRWNERSEIFHLITNSFRRKHFLTFMRTDPRLCVCEFLKKWYRLKASSGLECRVDTFSHQSVLELNGHVSSVSL